MSVLILDAAHCTAIREAIERARRKPLPLDVVRRGMPTTENPGRLSLADRPPGIERPPSEAVELGDYVAAISFEVQPIGLCRHLSVSAPRAGTLPPVPTLVAIAAAFGFKYFAAGDLGQCAVWNEEFRPGHYAVNIVEPEVPVAVGHA